MQKHFQFDLFLIVGLNQLLFPTFIKSIVSKNVTMKPLFLFLLLFFTLAGCASTDVLQDVRGSWVEATGAGDTIAFNGKNMLTVSRERILNNAMEWRPGPGSGPYEYEISGDSIHTYWVASSKSGLDPYYFNSTGNQFVVGNFYDAQKKGQLMTFNRIHD